MHHLFNFAFAASILTASLMFQTSAARAEILQRLYNTGPSTFEEAKDASLNIRFYPCANDNALFCASVVSVVEPYGPSGQDMAPDGQPVIGYEMITGLKSKGKGKYRGGVIVALDESIIKGKIVRYGIKVNDRSGGDLEARGCLGFICPRKMIWTVVEESESAAAQ